TNLRHGQRNEGHGHYREQEGHGGSHPGELTLLAARTNLRGTLTAHRDDVHVKVTGLAQHFLHYPTRHVECRSRTAGPQDNLRAPFGTGERHQCASHVFINDLLKRTVELADESAGGGRVGLVEETVGIDHVHGHQFSAG